jgi:hypothetical protein
MLLSLGIAILLAVLVLLALRRVSFRYRLLIAVVLIALGSVPIILALVVGDKPAPGDVPYQR